MKKILLFLLASMMFVTAGCGSEAGNSTDIAVTDNNSESNVIYEAATETIETDYREKTVIQVNDTVLKLNESTVKDFIRAGAHFLYEDINDEEVLEWTMNANQETINVYVDGIAELLLIRADYGEEKAIGDCIVGEVEVRFKDVDVLSTDINTIREVNGLFFNGGANFGETLENTLEIHGPADSDFIADYGYTQIKELYYDSENEHVLTC